MEKSTVRGEEWLRSGVLTEEIGRRVRFEPQTPTVSKQRSAN